MTKQVGCIVAMGLLMASCGGGGGRSVGRGAAAG